MMISPLLAVSFGMNVVAVIFGLCAVVLVLVILIQKGKGGGLSGAFGGGMAAGVLGSKTGDFLTWFTIGLVAVFLMLAVVMAKFYRPSVSDRGRDVAVQQSQPIEQAPPVEQGQELPPVVPAGEGVDTNSPGGN